MKPKRLWWTIRTALTRGGNGRADYARRHNIYAHVGKNVSFQPRFVPVYSELISFGNNVTVARNVDFITHDVIHSVLNCLPEEERKRFRFKERIGCIEVCDNVFIGSNSIILYDTKIGPNVVIGSGSVVTGDCEPNSVYAGVPARKIGSFEDYVNRRIDEESSGHITTTTHNQKLTEEEVDAAWMNFRAKHDK